jgi:hypothetical protein
VRSPGASPSPDIPSRSRLETPKPPPYADTVSGQCSLLILQPEMEFVRACCRFATREELRIRLLSDVGAKARVLSCGVRSKAPQSPHSEDTPKDRAVNQHKCAKVLILFYSPSFRQRLADRPDRQARARHRGRPTNLWDCKTLR